MTSRRQFVLGGLGAAAATVLPSRLAFGIELRPTSVRQLPVAQLDLLPNAVWFDRTFCWAIGRSHGRAEVLCKLHVDGQGRVNEVEPILDVLVQPDSKACIVAVVDETLLLGGSAWITRTLGTFDAGEVSDVNYPRELVSPPIPRTGGGLIPLVVEQPVPWLAVSPVSRPEIVHFVDGLPSEGFLVRIMTDESRVMCWTFTMDDLGGSVIETEVDLAGTRGIASSIVVSGIGEAGRISRAGSDMLVSDGERSSLYSVRNGQASFIEAHSGLPHDLIRSRADDTTVIVTPRGANIPHRRRQVVPLPFERAWDVANDDHMVLLQLGPAELRLVDLRAEG